MSAAVLPSTYSTIGYPTRLNLSNATNMWHIVEAVIQAHRARTWGFQVTLDDGRLLRLVPNDSLHFGDAEWAHVAVESVNGVAVEDPISAVLQCLDYDDDGRQLPIGSRHPGHIWLEQPLPALSAA